MMSNLKFITDARGKVTTFDYDGFNRVKKVTYPPGPLSGGPFESFTYDGAGHLWTRTDRKGVVTTYGYDNTGRLSGKTYSDGSPAVTFTYDSVGRLKTGANDADSLILTYDLAGQLKTEASVANNSTITYTYDLAGNRQGVLINGVVYLVSVYDDAERLWYTSSQASPSQPWKTSYFGYDDANRRTALLYPNLMEAFYGYDTLSRLTAVLHYDVTTRPATLRTYASYNPYDAAGSRTIRAIPSYSDSYGYDSLYRLKTVTRSGTLTEQYTYDAVGNRLSALGDPTWAYDDRNQLQSHGGTTAPLGYDLNGNLTLRNDSSGNWTYEWTVENLLKRVTKNGTEVARFAYDPLGRRISRTVGATLYRYLYDGQDILQETAGASTYRFVHGPGVDETLAAEVPGGASLYYHADGLGSMVLLTDSNRTSIWGYLYDGFGQIQFGGSVGGYAFTGREWDPETGLYYYRARYYDPKLGRFINEDPIGFGGGGNFYRYVGNNPTTRTDPLGLYSCYYYIANHVLVCEPDESGDPWFLTGNMTSGSNGPENPRKHYSECDSCQDNPRRTNRSGRGPMPEGTYNIGSMGSNPNHPTWRFLTPNPIPRTGFYTHFCPNRLMCSEGCISFTNSQEFGEFNRLMNLEPNNIMTVRGGGRRHTRCGCD